MITQTTHDKKMSDIINRHITAALREILSDPDQGLVLKSNALRRIRSSMRSKEAGKTKNLADVLATYGV